MLLLSKPYRVEFHMENTGIHRTAAATENQAYEGVVEQWMRKFLTNTG